MKLIIGNESYDTAKLKLIGSGGEADVFEMPDNKVLKVFKTSDHPSLSMSSSEQKKAIDDKLVVYNQKMNLFPSHLPTNVISPLSLARDEYGDICGYTMAYIKGAELLKKYGEKPFRKQFCSNTNMVSIFCKIHETVAALHKKGVVIGDFNDLNILVKGLMPYFIDSDSYQFGKFYSVAYTERFVDPVICEWDAKLSSMMLTKPLSEASDWYSFNVLLMQNMLFLAGGPYGGVYAPKNKSSMVQRNKRPLHRITVFNGDVMYPTTATPMNVLTDDLLHYFQQVFTKDLRQEFPAKLLDMKWTTCATCGIEHSRNQCPSCKSIVQAPVETKSVIVVHGKVKKTLVYRAPVGTDIVHARLQNQKICFVTRKGNSYFREDGTELFNGAVTPDMFFRIKSANTIVSKGNQIIELDGQAKPVEMQVCDQYKDLFACFDTNATSKFWCHGGVLYQSGKIAPEMISQVMRERTMFWVGEKLGAGFYQVGGMLIGFIFRPGEKGILDTLKMPIVNGQVLNARAVFGDKKVWFFFSFSKGSKLINYCSQYSASGVLEATCEVEDGEDHWLGTLNGKCSIGDVLYSVTDDGIARVNVENQQFAATHVFNDTKPFVNSDSQLYAANNGIYVWGDKEIFLLQMT